MIKEMRKKKKKGFSLVELIVVIAIIGILSAIAVPKYSQYQQSAKINADKATAKMVAEAALMAVETGELTITQVNGATSATDTNVPWTAIKKYISGNAAITSNTSAVWTVFMGEDSSRNVIRVYSGESYDAAVIKAELEY